MKEIKPRFRLNLQLFAEENPKPEEQPKPQPQPTEANSESVQKMAEALKELKANSVSKNDYDKILNENRELTKAIIDGSSSFVKSNNEAEKKPDIKQLAKDIFEDGLSNYELAKRELKFRDAYIEKFGKDPFAPNNPDMNSHDAEAASKVARIMQECINECKGEPHLYDALFNEKIKDDSPQLLASIEKRRRGTK